MNAIHFDSQTIQAQAAQNHAAQLLRIYDQYVTEMNLHGCTTWIKTLSPADQELLILATTKRREV